jgi:lantibiotic modifying enzyme
MHTLAPSLLCSLVPFVAAQDAPQQGAQPAERTDRIRDTVRGAIQWIERQAVPVPGVEGAVLFPGTEGKRGLPQTCIYGGTAGVSIFLENAAAVLDDATARTLADRTMQGLLASRRVDSRDRATWSRASTMGTTGLYTGDAGVGHAFLVRHALRGDAKALAAAVDVGEVLLARARVDGETLTFDNQVEIVFGNAGTALFLLELGLATKDNRFTDAARRTGHGLVADAELVPSTADEKQQLPTWHMKMGNASVHMPGFSHGTAGVAYALARIGAHTGDKALLQAAKDGAQWLREHAVTDGATTKWAASDRGPQVFMGGWCHGPAGTCRLFLLLHAITGEASYREVAEQGANFLVLYAAEAAKTGPGGEKPYVPPSYCCGVAGVVEFFCDLHRVTKDPAHAAFAKKAGDYLVDVALADGDGRKWRNGQTAPGAPVSASAQDCNVDLMLGAAGEGLALLRLLTLDRAEDPIRGLPDRTVKAPVAPVDANAKKR